MENNLSTSNEAVKEIAMSLSSYIFEIKDEYLKANLKEEQFSEFVIGVLSKGLKIYNVNEHGERNAFFCRHLSISLKQKVKDNLDEQINRIVTYVNNNIKIDLSIYMNIKSIKQIISYIKSQEIELSIETMQLILMKSNIINLLLSNVTHYINETKNNKILESDDEVYEFIENYCSLKEISLYNDETTESLLMTESIKQYLKEIGIYRVFSKEESFILEKRMIEGDDKARELLITHNLKLVVKIAKRYVNRGLEFMDLIQLGNLGLVKATEKFDLSRGVKFASYAGWWIRQTIRKGLKKDSKIIRKPDYVEDMLLRLNICENKLAIKNSGIPTDEELAQELNMHLNEIRCLRGFNEDTASLNAIVDNDETRELIFCIKTKDNTEEEAERSVLIGDVLKNYLSIGLSEREMEILKYRNGFINNRVYSHREIAPILGISAPRVQQIEHDAILVLRDYFNGTHNFRKRRRNKNRQVS